jgi:hypothetical protein
MSDVEPSTQRAVRQLRAELDIVGEQWPASTRNAIDRAWLDTMREAHRDGSIDALATLAEQHEAGGVLADGGPFTATEVAAYCRMLAANARGSAPVTDVQVLPSPDQDEHTERERLRALLGEALAGWERKIVDPDYDGYYERARIRREAGLS